MNKTHGMSKTPEWKAYSRAKNRCQNPNSKDYKNYGGRGIEFKFSSFEEFFSEVGLRPNPNMQLDRINNNKHYEKANIRWATKSEQMLNRRKYFHKNRRKSKGYSFDKQTGKYRSAIYIGGKKIDLGRFNTKNEAALAYKKQLQRVEEENNEQSADVQQEGQGSSNNE